MNKRMILVETLVDVRKYMNKLLDMSPNEVQDSLLNNGESIVIQISRALRKVRAKK